MRIKRILLTLFVFIIAFSVPSNATSEPSIKVGIVFGSGNQQTIKIQSETGFNFGFYDKDAAFKSLVDFSQFNTLTFAKSGYYNYLKNGTAELVTEPADYYTNGSVLGGYHLALSKKYATYDEAIVDLVRAKMANAGFYLAYEKGFNIYIGAYESEAKAAADIGVVQALMPGFGVEIVTPNSGRVVVLESEVPIFAYDSNESDCVFTAPIFTVNQVKYRNGFSVVRKQNSDLTVINRVEMSHYLYGVLPKEMNGAWPLEALKAQAVAARNYALQNQNKYAHFGFDVCNTVASQVYGGYSAEHPNSNQAVDETKGQFLYYNDALVQCYYHANSGGITELSGNVWSSNLPYLKAVPDPYSIGASNTDWIARFTPLEIKEKLSIAGYDIGTLTAVRILERSISGRVTVIQFVGTLSTATLNKDLSRRVLGASLLKSMHFSLSEEHAITEIPTHLSTPTRFLAPQGVVTGEGISFKVQNNTMLVASTSRGTYSESFDKWRYLNASAFNVDSDQATYAVFEEHKVSGSEILFYGHGFGHGVGLSQWGAKKMADLGFAYDAILAHYFRGSTIRYGQ